MSSAARVRAATPAAVSVETGATLTCRGLQKRFGERLAVDDLSFEIRPGVAYGLLGPNGAGKTTTIRMICGLTKPDAGSVVIDGHDLETDPLAAKAAIGYVPHEVALYRDLPALDQLVFFGRVRGLSKRVARERAHEALEFVGLTDRAGERVDRMSDGMQRRLNLAVALVGRPRLLVLDEPMVGIDPHARAIILDRVSALRADGVSILCTSHYINEIERLCDLIAIIDEGRLVAEGTVDSLLATLDVRQVVRIGANGELAALRDDLDRLKGITTARLRADALEVVAEDASLILAEILSAASALGISITSVDVVEPDLEQAFIHLTGHELGG